MAWPTEAGILTRLPAPRAAKRRRRRRPPSAVFLAATATVTLSVVRLGTLSQITATTQLGGLVYYTWYLDGRLVQKGTSNQLTVSLDSGVQGRIACYVSNSATYDPAPQSYPRTRTVRWLRSADDSTRKYRIDQAKADPDAITAAELVAKSTKDLTAWGTWDAWTEVATIDRDAEAWSYERDTAVLDDTSVYKWRAVPLDAVGNAGPATETSPIKSSRRPDAPDFAVTFDEGTTRVTFAES